MVQVIEWNTSEAEVPSSEDRFLNAAKRELPDDWTVIHGLRIKAGKPLRDQEIDFVVIDPGRGVLIIEVKGGGIERNGNNWYSNDRHGVRHSISDPIEQANNCRYAIKDRLKASVHWRMPRVPKMASAVAFPDVDCDMADLGPDLPIECLIDRGDLKNLKAVLIRTLDEHPKKVERLPASAIQAFCAALKPPSYSLPASLAAQLDADTDALDRLTKEQAEVLMFLERHRRAAIEGAAGTGKTVLAEIKAEQLAGEGARVLFLCFNRSLAESLAQSVRNQPFDVRHFHGFCDECATKAGLPFTPPEDASGKEIFYDKQAPSILMDALEKLPEYRFGAIVVDEAQDFKNQDWWAAIELALHDGTNGVLYAFYDPVQNIYDGSGPSEALAVHPVTLTKNCRNTRRIAEHAASLVGIDYDFGPETPDGPAIESIPYVEPREMVDKVRRLLHRLIHDKKIAADRVTVLSTRSPARSHLAKKRHLGNFRLTEKPEGRKDVRFTSLHRFKGLESDVVILTDVDGNPNSCSDRHLYVAATRARWLLFEFRAAQSA